MCCVACCLLLIQHTQHILLSQISLYLHTQAHPFHLLSCEGFFSTLPALLTLNHPYSHLTGCSLLMRQTQCVSCRSVCKRVMWNAAIRSWRPAWVSGACVCIEWRLNIPLLPSHDPHVSDSSQHASLVACTHHVCVCVHTNLIIHHANISFHAFYALQASKASRIVASLSPWPVTWPWHSLSTSLPHSWTAACTPVRREAHQAPAKAAQQDTEKVGVLSSSSNSNKACSSKIRG